MRLILLMSLLSLDARAIYYDQRRTELQAWVAKAPCADDKQRNALRTAMDNYANQMESWFVQLSGTILTTDGSAKKWSDVVSSGKTLPENSFGALPSQLGEPISEALKNEINLIKGEELELVNAVSAGNGIATAADEFVKIRGEIEKYRTETINKSLYRVHSEASDLNRIGRMGLDELMASVREMEDTLYRVNIAAMAILDNLSKALGVALNDFQQVSADKRRWDAALNALRGLYSNEVLAIAQEMCRTVGEEGDVERAVNAAVSRTQSSVRPAYDDAVQLGNSMARRLESLIAGGSAPSNAPDMLRQITDKVTSVQNLFAKTPALQGSLSPKLKTIMERGSAKHRELQRGGRCIASEVRTSAGNIDCVMLNGNYCEVHEIKSGNGEARSDGLRKAGEYIGALKQAIQSAGKDLESLYRTYPFFRQCSDPKSDPPVVRLMEVPVIDSYMDCPVPVDDIAERMSDL